MSQQPTHADTASSSRTEHSPTQEIEEKYENQDELPQDLEKDEEHSSHELAKKPMSAYLGVCFMCVLIAFGGFVFGFDTGTISGFVNMDDFKRRFGQQKSDGTYYFSNVRTGLIIAMFNAGCAVGQFSFRNPLIYGVED